MRLAPLRRSRAGVTVVEFAVISTITFFLVFAIIIGGLGIFRFQEVSHLAREGSRYASTHGGKYKLAGLDVLTGVPAVASNSDMRNYLLPKAHLLDPNLLTIAVSWTASGKYLIPNMPTYSEDFPNVVPPGQNAAINYVTVTVTYQWYPELFLKGPITLTSTSTLPMSY